MKLKIETVEANQSVLLIAKKASFFVDFFKKELLKQHAEIFFSPNLPNQINQFDYCFVINDDSVLKKIHKIDFKKIVLIYINNSINATKAAKLHIKNVKIIDIDGDIAKLNNIENIIWFVLSRTKENFLKIHLPKIKKDISPRKTERLTINVKRYLNKKRLILLIIIGIIIFHIAFIPFFAFSAYSTYKAALAIKNSDENQINNYLNYSDIFLKLTKKIYSFSRPSYLLFSLALVPDNLIDINDKTKSLLKEFIEVEQHTKDIFRLLIKNDKNEEEKKLMSLRIDKLKTTVPQLEENLNLLNQKIPSYFPSAQKIKEELLIYSEIVAKMKQLIPYFDNIFAKQGEKKYLLLFANNRELRPGGGFIGSFGILTLKNYTLKDIKIYDVYDADGQLVAHIEPPDPIKKYLQQPHWFLRDSAFSPDFLENYAQAKFFLEKELNQNNFSGAFLITTTAIENILEAFGDIYLPDLHESINSKNFYIKTQISAENNFFPGSIQKKSFLSSLIKQIILNLETASTRKLFFELKRSLDEKQINIYFEDLQLQNIFDNYYWSGRVIDAQCPNNSDNCFVDYIFPYDANLGVNKANFYITRQLVLKTSINTAGEINHLLTIKFRNDSPADIFPGGTYKNYFQILLPNGAQIKTITKNDTLVDSYDQIENVFKKIGFYFEVAPKGSAEIKIDYQLEKTINKGKNTYQLIVQKQIGSSNNDFNLEITLPNNIYFINQNFSPLVKDNQMIYNTTLLADKIFFIELIRD